MERNGSIRLIYWIMGALLTTIFALGGLGAKDFHDRLLAVESIQRARTDTLSQFDGDIHNLREQICRLESKVDDLREEVTGKKVYRRPCP